MIYRHKKSGDLYTRVLDYWDVERQAHYVLFVGLHNGAFFGRSKDAFHTNFEYVEDSQHKLQPRPHPYIADTEQT